jgi:plasmid stabilization system protein ParE
MASGEPPLSVKISPSANADLWEIWLANLERYQSVAQADGYVDFLKQGINLLASQSSEGRPLEGFPEYRFVTLKKSQRGHGHCVIFKVDLALRTVKVLRVLHTRMDIPARLWASDFDEL